MRSFLRATGALLVLAGIGGIVFSLAVIVLLWRGQPQVETAFEGSLILLEDTLRVTGEGLDAAAESLDATITSVASMETTLNQVADATGQSVPVIENLVTLTQDELPATIRSAQVSLVSAQDAAQVIDRILRAIAGIPLLGRSLSYNPQVPMHEALGQVISDLDSVPATLEEIGESVSSTDDTLLAIQASLELMAVDIRGVSSGLEQSQEVVSQYQTVIADLQERTSRTRASLPGMLDGASWFLSLLFAWLGVAQLGVITEGLRMLGMRLDPPLRDQVSSGS